MTETKRIQRKRTKGWRLPDGAMCVDRTSRYGNPYKVEDVGREVAVKLFAEHVRELVSAADFDRLRGHDLACYCKLDEVCHADVLLALARREGE
jgi:Domain of unknown function (DUF4326)